MEEQPSHASLQPMAGADHIRALTDSDEQFKAFDSYPWKSDKAFLFGLKAILGAPAPPPRSSSSTNLNTPSQPPQKPQPPQPQSQTEQQQGQQAEQKLQQQSLSSPHDISLRARLFYYSKRIGVTLNYENYKTWLSKNPRHKSPDVLPEEYKLGNDSIPPPGPAISTLRNSASNGATTTTGATTAAAGAPLPWQSSAPKTELYVPRGEADGEAAKGGDRDEKDQAPYPPSFAQIIALITKGEPVPGIREIPDTLATDTGVTPYGKMVRPRKPWETAAAGGHGGGDGDGEGLGQGEGGERNGEEGK